MLLLILSRSSDSNTAAVSGSPASAHSLESSEEQAADAGEHQRGATGHGRLSNVSIHDLAESVSESTAALKDSPLSGSPPLSPRSIGSPELVEARDGQKEQCIRVKCKQLPSRYSVLSVQQTANELLYQDKDYLPDGPQNYLRIPTSLIENARGTDYVRTMTTIVDFVKEVESRRARQIAELEREVSRRAQLDAMRWLKEKVFLTFLALFCLSISMLGRPGKDNMFILLVSAIAFTSMVAAISGTIRDSCQRYFEDVAACFADIWHAIERLALALCAMTFVQWHVSRVSRVRGPLLALFKTFNWFDKTAKKMSSLIYNFRYGFLLTFALTNLIYWFGSLTRCTLAASLRLSCSKLYNAGTTMQLRQNYLSGVCEVMNQLTIDRIPPMAGYLEQGRLIILGSVGALVALSAVGYRAVQRWQRRTNPNTSGFMYNCIVKLVSTVEEVQRTLVATEHRLKSMLFATARYFRKHWFAISVLIMINLSTVDYAFDSGVQAKMAEITTSMPVRLYDPKTLYPDVQFCILAIIASPLLRRIVFPLPDLICQGLLDTLGAIFVVAWRWPWKMIVRCLVGLVLGTIWLAGTITLGIWGFHAFIGPMPTIGPVPVLDMLIQYPNGGEAQPVRIVR